jgi:hypothetical protein
MFGSIKLYDFQYGAPRTTLKEPLLFGTDYKVQWRESRVNLTELAKLRYIEGWSRQQLADHYQRTLFAITNYCQNIRKKDFNLDGLTSAEREKIRWAFKN